MPAISRHRSGASLHRPQGPTIEGGQLQRGGESPSVTASSGAASSRTLDRNSRRIEPSPNMAASARPIDRAAGRRSVPRIQWVPPRRGRAPFDEPVEDLGGDRASVEDAAVGRSAGLEVVDCVCLAASLDQSDRGQGGIDRSYQLDTPAETPGLADQVLERGADRDTGHPPAGVHRRRVATGVLLQCDRPASGSTTNSPGLCIVAGRRLPCCREEGCSQSCPSFLLPSDAPTRNVPSHPGQVASQDLAFQTLPGVTIPTAEASLAEPLAIGVELEVPGRRADRGPAQEDLDDLGRHHTTAEMAGQPRGRSLAGPSGPPGTGPCRAVGRRGVSPTRNATSWSAGSIVSSRSKYSSKLIPVGEKTQPGGTEADRPGGDGPDPARRASRKTSRRASMAKKSMPSTKTSTPSRNSPTFSGVIALGKTRRSQLGVDRRRLLGHDLGLLPAQAARLAPY